MSEFGFMERCDALALIAKANGFSPVGAVIVVDGVIVSEASELCPSNENPFGHAELLALEAAVQRVGKEALQASILYSTHEPCAMCAYAIREFRVSRVVMRQAVGEIGGVDGVFRVLSSIDVPEWGPPPEVVWWDGGPQSQV